jgi:hypothetical protein
LCNGIRERWLRNELSKVSGKGSSKIFLSKEGLKLTEETSQRVTFEGGRGFVTVTISSEKGYTEVDLVTQEWDYQVKRFASDLL